MLLAVERGSLECQKKVSRDHARNSFHHLTGGISIDFYRHQGHVIVTQGAAGMRAHGRKDRMFEIKQALLARFGEYHLKSILAELLAVGAEGVRQAVGVYE